MKGETGRKGVKAANYEKTYANYAFDKTYNMNLSYKSFKTI